MTTESNNPIPHNPNQLGKPMRNSKKRSSVFIVVIISIAVHVLAGLGLAAVKIIEVLQPEPEFEAPPVVEVTPPPPPPPPPPTKRTQRSLPRPQPLAAQNPKNMSVPAIQMQASDVSFGRGMGGGLGELGGGIMDRVDISFFGIEGGENMVILMDRTGSGSGVFERTRAELLKTIESMQGSTSAKLAVIYFGGKIAGMRGIPAKNKKQLDPTKHDYWWPKGVSSNRWLSPDDREIAGLVADLNEVDLEAEGLVTTDRRKVGHRNAAFVLGTQFWGAMNAAYRLDPAPETIYFMIEPNVAFPSDAIVNKSFAIFEKYGVPKPEGTKVIFIIGNDRGKVKKMSALQRMVRLVNGGDLSPSEINKLIVFVK